MCTCQDKFILISMKLILPFPIIRISQMNSPQDDLCRISNAFDFVCFIFHQQEFASKSNTTLIINNNRIMSDSFLINAQS